MNSLESWSSALFNGQWGCFAVSSRAGISWLTHQICIRHVDSSVMVITGFSAVPDPWSSWWMWGPSTGCITVRKSACPLWCWTSFWAHSSIACSIALTSFCYETITATCTSGKQNDLYLMWYLYSLHFCRLLCSMLPNQGILCSVSLLMWLSTSIFLLVDMVRDVLGDSM